MCHQPWLTLSSSAPKVDGQELPYELGFSRWLTDWVLRLCTDGGLLSPREELRIAARGQHVERWLVPRVSYPEVITGKGCCILLRR